MKTIEKQKREANREQTEAEARARKSAQNRIIRETIVTINASYGGQNVAVSIALGETIVEKRRQIGDALKVSKGKRAQLALICQDTIVSNNPRSTIKKFGLHNGGVLEMSGLRGGAKLRMEQPSYTCTQTGRSTDIQKDRQTDRETDRPTQTDGRTDRQKDRQT